MIEHSSRTKPSPRQRLQALRDQNPLLERILRHPGRWLRERAQSRGLVLMYHAIEEVEVDPWELFVSPANFDRHLATIARSSHPMRLADLADAHTRQALPKAALSVTFDDGYANNLTVALPLLEKHDIPATVFVVADGIGSEREFWWDELGQIVFGSAPPTGVLELRGSAGEVSSFSLSSTDGARESDGASAGRDALHRALWEHLLDLRPAERDRALEQIASWCGHSPEQRPTHRPLTHDELEALDRHPLIDIGAHTLTHPWLPRLGPEDQRFEVGRSGEALERLLGHRIETFSYPFGANDDASVAAVRDAGFAAACATHPVSVSRRSDVMRLPRMDTRNWSGPEMERKMQRWQRYH